MFIEKILEIFGASPIVLAILIAFWKGDDALGSDLKKDLSESLRSTSLSINLDYSNIIASMYDRLFGNRFLSFRFILVSVITSLFLYISLFYSLVILSNTPDGPRQPSTDIVFVVFVGFAFNCFIDYFANIETRLVVALWERGKLSSQASLIVDLILTFGIFFLWSELLIYFILDGTDPFGASLFFIFSDQTAPYLAMKAALITTYATSVWIWLIILFSTVPVASNSIWVGRLLDYALPINDRPVRSIGVVAATFALFLYAVF